MKSACQSKASRGKTAQSSFGMASKSSSTAIGRQRMRCSTVSTTSNQALSSCSNQCSASFQPLRVWNLSVKENSFCTTACLAASLSLPTYTLNKSCNSSCSRHCTPSSDGNACMCTMQALKLHLALLICRCVEAIGAASEDRGSCHYASQHRLVFSAVGSLRH